MALQVIGAGFGRTGTLSLNLALERLGVGRRYHMLEFRERPDHVPLWRQVADGRQGLWDAIFDRYRASVDWPGMPVLARSRDPLPGCQGHLDDPWGGRPATRVGVARLSTSAVTRSC